MNSDCSTDAGASSELNSIIAQLKHESGTLPERAIHGARQNAEQITPALIELIDHATREHRQGRTPQDNGHLLSLYLLAEFRATEAWPSLLEAISLADEGPFDLFGDAITEDFAYIIATLAGDRHQDVAALLSDRSIDVFVRWQAAEAMMHFVRDGIVTRESAIGQMEAHLHQAIEDGDGELAECFVFRLEDLAAESAVPLIEDVFRRGLIDQNLVTLEPILADIAGGEQQFQDSMSPLKVVEDLVEHLKDWAEFSSYDDDVSDDLLFEQLFDAEDPATPGTGSLNAEHGPSRIGRNEPCTCGSGKKYKKCCGRR